MALDLFAPLIATLFFVTATLAGIYLYCCYFRTSKEENDPEKFADKARHNLYEDGSSVGVPTTNFYNYLYPLSMTLPAKIYDVDVGFPSSPLNKTPVVSEKNARVLISPFEDRDLTELSHVAVRTDRPLLCRTISNDIKWVNSHCQLQVIQEVDEEEILDGEEAKVGA